MLDYKSDMKEDVDLKMDLKIDMSGRKQWHTDLQMKIVDLLIIKGNT